MFRVDADASMNAMDWQHRTAPGGTADFGAWGTEFNGQGLDFTPGYVQAVLLTANGVNASLCYHARVRVYHSSNANDQSAWGNGLFGACPGGALGFDFVIRYDRGQLYTFAAAPVVYFSAGDHIVYYAAGPGGVGVPLGKTWSAAALLAKGMLAGPQADWVNPVSGKPVTVTWDGEGLITLATFYADTVHDSDKPVVITIDPGGHVNILAW